MSLGRPTQPFYLETSILFFFEQLNKAGIYNNLIKAMLYFQIKDHDSPYSQFFLVFQIWDGVCLTTVKV